MEPQKIVVLLDLAKQIIATTPSVAQHGNARSILPHSIRPLSEGLRSLPEDPIPLQTAIEVLKSDILPYLNAASLSSRYYGFVTGGVTPAALIGDILASVYDQNVMVHLPAETISTNVEVAALNMLVDLFDLPRDHWAVGTSGNGGGVFTTGATASNILGLTLGREFVLSAAVLRKTGKAMSVGEHGLLAVSQAAQIDHVKVLSTLPHSSIVKAASIVGMGRANVTSITKEGTVLDIDIEQLKRLAEGAEADRTAYILAISAGEVNTGHFASDSHDMIREVRNLCDRYGIWIHVDGAFGLFGRVLTNHKDAGDYEHIINDVRGLELADSITADGHKLLNVPYDCGIFFTRHKALSEATCSNGNAAYLRTGAPTTIQSPGNISLENSRRFRALPVYATLSAYGRAGYSDMLIRQIGLCRKIAAWLWDHDQYDLLPRSVNRDMTLAKIFIIVLFRAKDGRMNDGLVQKIKDSGKIYVSGTVWDGKSAVRIAVSNWRVDVEADFEVVKEVLENVLIET